MSENQDPSQVSETRRGSAWAKPLRWIAPLAAVVGAAFLALFLYRLLYPAPAPPTQGDVEASVQRALASATPPPPDSTQVYQTILPSLVFIKTRRADAADDKRVGVGSGVVVNEGGDILTAYHVVDDATEIEVVFADGSQANAEILAAEPEKDIALLHPRQPPELIVPAVLGNPRAMRVGDPAYAVGNPLGLVASMSAGVISGFDRSVPIRDSDLRLQGLIQFDTAVNPGNSGGPLLNREGQVVGIVTALANPTEQSYFIGIGFAVPIGTALAAGGGGPAY